MNEPKLRPVLKIYKESALFWAQERDKARFSEESIMTRVLGRLRAGDELLDLGCGSGYPIADFFLKNGINVTGVDGAAAMISIAQERFPEGRWLVADMRTLALGQKFQAVIAWDSFFHLTHAEQESMFPIFRKHLEPGGALVFTSGNEKGEAIGDMNGNPLFHASFSPAEYRALLEANGMEAMEFLSSEASGVDRNVWLCRARA